ncbi:MAG: hypothetical protein FOGNACKC_00615 [Anaerolineae bacterium]|nr:hypothetical protein [Anaerolineae bacterium]
MTSYLPQKYQEVARELIPYRGKKTTKLALIQIGPTLPCILCNNPATNAIIAPAPEQAPGAWLTFPICDTCEERQIKTEAAQRG